MARTSKADIKMEPPYVMGPSAWSGVHSLPLRRCCTIFVLTTTFIQTEPKVSIFNISWFFSSYAPGTAVLVVWWTSPGFGYLDAGNHRGSRSVLQWMRAMRPCKWVLLMDLVLAVMQNSYLAFKFILQIGNWYQSPPWCRSTCMLSADYGFGTLR